MQPWRPSGIVTLLTDFGSADPYVGIMKGVLASARDLRLVVDLTHEVAPQDVDAASFFLANSWWHFPAGSVHVGVVDPGVGSPRAILAARAAGHAFLAPDNGLLAEAIGGLEDARVVRAEPERFGLEPKSRTFHGRDLFAPLAALVVDGLGPTERGSPVRELARLPAEPPRQREDGTLEGRVRIVDRFGNLITNVGGEALAGGRSRVSVAGRELPLVATYADVAPGALAALVDSYGLLEVAQRDGSAARTLGVGVGESVLVPAGPAGTGT